MQVFGFSLLRTHIIPLSKYQPSIYGLRRVAADYFARWFSTTRHFPDPPGIGGRSEGFRKYLPTVENYGLPVSRKRRSFSNARFSIRET